MDPPLHPSTVDVVPPAVTGLPQTRRCGLALKRPQAVGAIILTKVAPDGHDDFTVGTLEVESLTVAIDPAHVIMVLRLSRHWGQQRQQHQSWIHDEEISPSAALLHICLSLYSSKPFVVQMFCIQEWCVICCWQDKSTSRPCVILRWTLRQSFHKVLVQMKVYLKRQRCNPLENTFTC